MAILDKLKLVNATRPENKGGAKLDPIFGIRARFIQAAQEQLEMIRAKAEGKEYAQTRTAYEGEGEDRRAVEVSKRVRSWTFKVGARFYVSPLYGTRRVIINGHNAIEAGNKIDGVTNVLHLLIESTEAGELDDALREAAKQRGGRGKAQAAPERTPRSRRPAK